MHHATATSTLTAITDVTSARFHAAGFLAGYSGNTRETYGIRLRVFFDWCDDHGLDILNGVSRPHLELYARYLEEVRGNQPASVHGALCVLKMFYRVLAVDQVIPTSPAEYVRMPKVYFDDLAVDGMSRVEIGSFLATARVMSPNHGALAVLLAMLGLRVSEACAVQIEDFSTFQQDHRVLKVIGKGHKPATIPLPSPVFRVLDDAAGGRTSGQLLYRIDGVTPLDRKAAYRMTQTIGRQANIATGVNPHRLRHAFVTAALDAGVPLRDVQIAARHADPRTTNRYDRARHNLDRHANHVVSAYLMGAA